MEIPKNSDFCGKLFSLKSAISVENLCRKKPNGFPKTGFQNPPVTVFHKGENAVNETLRFCSFRNAPPCPQRGSRTFVNRERREISGSSGRPRGSICKLPTGFSTRCGKLWKRIYKPHGKTRRICCKSFGFLETSVRIVLQ